jgi:hypothetical protein
MGDDCNHKYLFIESKSEAKHLGYPVNQDPFMSFSDLLSVFIFV